MRISLLLSALLANSITFAATPVDGWYTSLFVGYDYLPANINTIHNNLYFDYTSYKGGYNAGGRAGFQSNPLRYELEYSFLYGHLTHFDINSVGQLGVSGYSTANLFMANMYYDFPEMLPAISPFLGLGIGYAYIQARLSSIYYLYPTTFSLNGSAFAYQGTAGITYNFAENYAVNISYRYVATGNSTNLGKAFQAHVASVGAIFRFDQVNYQ